MDGHETTVSVLTEGIKGDYTLISVVGCAVVSLGYKLRVTYPTRSSVCGGVDDFPVRAMSPSQHLMLPSGGLTMVPNG